MGVLNTTPATMTSSHVVTASEWNTEIRDPLTTMQAAWTAYTPTTANITLGNGTVVGKYNRVGKTIDFFVQFTFGSTSSITGTPTFTLPVTSLTTAWAAADSTVFDTSASAFYPAAGVATSTTLVSARVLPGTVANPYAGISSTAPMTWATGDILTIQGRYEAA